MRIRPYQKLIAWQEAHQLCLLAYRATKLFPMDERFALVDQMRRSSSSVPTNIAEGNSRRTKKDHAKFLTIAVASLEELHYQFLLARDLEYITEEQYNAADDHIQRTGFLIGRLRASLL